MEETESLNSFHSEEERRVVLTPTEKEALLRADPSFRSVASAAYFDNYDLPCPVQVTMEKDTGERVDVVLRRNRHGDVVKEIHMFAALGEFGMPVPAVLVEPFHNDRGESEAVYSLLSGENLQKLSMRSDEDLQRAKELLVEAAIRLMNATPFIESHAVAKLMPRFTLAKELELLNDEGNPWLYEEVYRSAMAYLKPVLEKVDMPLVISNGDYQPGNFLAKDGKITGYLDFESASFQDPMMGFVKYPIYDMLPLSRTDLVETFLRKKGFSKEDFTIRLAFGCLKILFKEIPVAGGDAETQEYRGRVLKLLRESIS
ncbi:MAG: hypothetical protein A3I44_03460 [Candidatus Sungbacteria bacterium RIFCSPLOWO2_02_FULL_51_17]|uniref:Aminoglycoside phosphotransferase domain-containing protein n=1 Tax=Candidatus Sungbacteria bacterium RIFCSPHIGHO2_02_FULL_51_29 TaxID=1802273 RepID=A0A1G2KU07_9BACT|nr:MAG: hypothetical protein A2676_01340 [Candidatus Sungbacteria bacterium RIFCSPHIGHO2_01_FULL_51_22]OHA02092.1 MAG: hypothetical protein A3C16_04745 [Candidatus Sungbacteria bacterium RIFCSPHIGHO2_02_FULL_51_29]OHA06130.1 MAG: hypothetical protein A3B29_01675 [Candidatus Sungbacteria bacterium RIFCSPLOWO2_01_FULL_51_34]OHA10448.1 MAG: hypothetical protein A3I44_03460 [Candidatus Sungbacteria bacterium RIFCSPLOWO2_02_FULL_51_17]